MSNDSFEHGPISNYIFVLARGFSSRKNLHETMQLFKLQADPGDFGGISNLIVAHSR
jgi:hypothetical protein